MMMRGLGYGIFLHLQKFCRMLNGTYSYSGNSHCLSEFKFKWVALSPFAKSGNPSQKKPGTGNQKRPENGTTDSNSQEREDDNTSHRTWDAVKALLSFTAAIISKLTSVIKMHHTRMRLFHQQSEKSFPSLAKKRTRCLDSVCYFLAGMEIASYQIAQLDSWTWNNEHKSGQLSMKRNTPEKTFQWLVWGIPRPGTKGL